MSLPFLSPLLCFTQEGIPPLGCSFCTGELVRASSRWDRGKQAQGPSTCNLPGVAKAGVCPRPALPVMFHSAALGGSVPSVNVNHVHFLAAEKLQMQLADNGCAACMRKLQEVGEAWHAAMSIFSWSSLPGPQVLVSSAVRGGGQVIGPDQWNVAGDVRRHFYDRPTPIHTLIPTSIPAPRFLFYFLFSSLETGGGWSGGGSYLQDGGIRVPEGLLCRAKKRPLPTSPHLLTPSDQNKWTYYLKPSTFVLVRPVSQPWLETKLEREEGRASVLRGLK